MKKCRTIFIILVAAVTLSSCNFFRNIFGGGDKYGCPTSVNNIGAEKLSGDYKPKKREEAKAIKRAAKANKKAAKRNPYMY